MIKRLSAIHCTSVKATLLADAGGFNVDKFISDYPPPHKDGIIQFKEGKIGPFTVWVLRGSADYHVHGRILLSPQKDTKHNWERTLIIEIEYCKNISHNIKTKKKQSKEKSKKELYWDAFNAWLEKYSIDINKMYARGSVVFEYDKSKYESIFSLPFPIDIPNKQTAELGEITASGLRLNVGKSDAKIKRIIVDVEEKTLKMKIFNNEKPYDKNFFDNLITTNMNSAKLFIRSIGK